MRSLVRRSLPAAIVAALTLSVPASASAATLYVSTSGSDSAACTQAAPCKSFSRAYTVATPGSEVIVAAGTYGGQDMDYLAVKATADKVVFRPATGASVTLGSLSIYNSQNIEVRDMVTGWQVRNGSKHIILRNLRILFLIFFIHRHNCIHPVTPQDSLQLHLHSCIRFSLQIHCRIAVP